MSKKGIIIGIILSLILGGGLIYRFTHLASAGGDMLKIRKQATMRKRRRP